MLLQQARLWALGIAVAVGAGVCASAEAPSQTRLSVDDARNMMDALLAQNQLQQAAEILEGLLLARPADKELLLLQARLAEAMGRPNAAAKARAKAWGLAKDGQEKFAVAALISRDMAAQNQKLRAEYWLRRAANHADQPATKALLGQEFATLRAGQRVGLTFGASLAPSSNVNNGSANATALIGGLPFVFTLSPEAQALSGVEASVNAGVTLRLDTRETAMTTADFGLYAKTVVLSEAAREKAPKARARDFEFVQASVALNHRWQPNDTSIWSFGAAASESRFGADPYLRTGTLRIGYDQTLGSADLVQLALTADDSLSLENGVRVKTKGMSASWQHSFAQSGKLRLGFGLTDAASVKRSQTYVGKSLELGYDFGEIAKGLTLDIRYDAEWRAFPSGGLVVGGRRDIRATLRAEMGLSDTQFYGFTPVVSVEGTQNRSNVALYDSKALRMGFSLRSDF